MVDLPAVEREPHVHERREFRGLGASLQRAIHPAAHGLKGGLGQERMPANDVRLGHPPLTRHLQLHAHGALDIVDLRQGRVLRFHLVEQHSAGGLAVEQHRVRRR